MLSPADLRQKFKIVPGGQSITYTMNPEGTQFQVDGARIQDIKHLDEVKSAGMQVGFNSKLWILPVDNMGGNEPKDGDKIDDGTNTWRVVGSMAAMMCGTAVEYKVVCSKER